MATVNIIPYKHHFKDSDKTMNLKLTIYHQGKYAYPATDYYITRKQLNKDLNKIIDQDLVADITVDLGKYRKAISALGRDRLNIMSPQDLSEYLLPTHKVIDEGENINFIEFGRSMVKDLKSENRVSYAGTLQAVINNLIDFTGSEFLYTQNITSDFLKKFEKYLRSPYVQVRKNQFGEEVKIEREGMKDNGIFAQMKNFRILFNAARDKYNDDDHGIIRIKNYPFKKYKLKEPPEPEKRSIPISVVKLIRDCEGLAPSGRGELGKDMFMLSFYLCGMNAVDIREIKTIKGGRINYNRSKTRDHRSDRALMSIKVVPEALSLLEKYVGTLEKRFSTGQNFQKAISIGLKQVALQIQKNFGESYEFDFYSARHTVGEEATNTLGYSVLDVGKVLNHSFKETKITNVYVRKNWAIVDEIQAAVISLLND